MDGHDLYRTSGPSAWAGAPAAFSFSSLKQMGVCLRRWQLGRSAYGSYKGYPERPSEAAEVGRIVHDLLSRLFRATALAGYPAIGAESFQRVIRTVDIVGTARRQLEAFARRAAASPRALGFRPRTTPREVYNQVAQAFRDEYGRVLSEKGAFTPIPQADPAPPGEAAATPAERLSMLERLGVLSEEHVRHPTLPLHGVIDLLVRRDGRTAVLDFKTGASRPEYQRQIQLYALLWWRSTGDLPAQMELRYGARVEGWPVSQDALCGLEEEMTERIAAHTRGLTARPAAATVGAHCEGCSVRQICSDYWAMVPRAAGAKGRGRTDIELLVSGSGARSGFVGQAGGQEITVVFDDDVGAAFGPFVLGERLRVLDGLWDPDAGALRLTKGTEVFRV